MQEIHDDHDSIIYLNVFTDISFQYLKLIQNKTQMKLILGIYYENQYYVGINWFNLAAKNKPTDLQNYRCFWKFKQNNSINNQST